MSATNRGTKRIEQDKYYTPPSAITPLLQYINWGNVTSILEPASGNGAIRNELAKVISSFTTITEYDIDTGHNYLLQPKPHTLYDITITNPPYSLATEFIEKAIDESYCTIMLLRLNFLESIGRKPFWEEYKPTHLFTLSQRPSFVSQCPYCKTFYPTGDYTFCLECLHGSRGINIKLLRTTDATGYGWFVWDSVGGFINTLNPFNWL